MRCNTYIRDRGINRCANTPPPHDKRATRYFNSRLNNKLITRFRRNIKYVIGNIVLNDRHVTNNECTSIKAEITRVMPNDKE